MVGEKENKRDQRPTSGETQIGCIEHLPGHYAVQTRYSTKHVHYSWMWIGRSRRRCLHQACGTKARLVNGTSFKYSISLGLTGSVNPSMVLIPSTII